MRKSAPAFNRKQWLVWALRRASYRWPGRYRAVAAARVERGRYQCALCRGLFGPRQIALDHIVPVVDPLTGFHDWNTFIDRMFVEESGYQVLCKATCHKLKTKQEGATRAATKRALIDALSELKAAVLAAPSKGLR